MQAVFVRVCIRVCVCVCEVCIAHISMTIHTIRLWLHKKQTHVFMHIHSYRNLIRFIIHLNDTLMTE